MFLSNCFVTRQQAPGRGEAPSGGHRAWYPYGPPWQAAAIFIWNHGKLRRCACAERCDIILWAKEHTNSLNFSDFLNLSVISCNIFNHWTKMYNIVTHMHVFVVFISLVSHMGMYLWCLFHFERKKLINHVTLSCDRKMATSPFPEFSVNSCTFPFKQSII